VKEGDVSKAMGMLKLSNVASTRTSLPQRISQGFFAVRRATGGSRALLYATAARASDKLLRKVTGES
jgi:hypothetical protein